MSLITTVQDWLGLVESSSAPVILLIGLVVIGCILRSSEIVPNNWILPALALIGAGLYPAIAEKQILTPGLVIRQGLFGIFIAFAAWGLAWPIWMVVTRGQKFIYKFIAKRIGLDENGNGDHKPKP